LGRLGGSAVQRVESKNVARVKTEGGKSKLAVFGLKMTDWFMGAKAGVRKACLHAIYLQQE